jgi:glycosyltransferase involved in cell wall biosynthesis
VTTLPKTVFVGKSMTGICWYRCALPAMALGQDWVGVRGAPPKLEPITGLTRRPFEFEHLAEHDVVVLQQPGSREWLHAIRRLQDAGVKVLFEIDDYVRSVRKIRTHEARSDFSRDHIEGIERNMRVADGLIVSTPFLAQRYRKFNANVWICRNGLDLRRYDVEPAPRSGVTIGWAGGVGHIDAMRPWLPVVADALHSHPDARFVTIGQPFADELAPEFGPDRCFSVPFAALEMYPAAMTQFDLALAPSSGSGLFRGKSDLRWLEASALGLPAIADPDVYSDIEHGVTGLHAATPEQAREALFALLADEALRTRIGAAARDHVREHRSIQAVAPMWQKAIAEVAGAVPAAV